MTAHELAHWLLAGSDAPVHIMMTLGPLVPDHVTQYSTHDITTRAEIRIHFQDGSRPLVLLIAEHTQIPRTESENK
jgi:hypothetical protein